MTIEIVDLVDLPIDSMVIFYSYVSFPEATLSTNYHRLLRQFHYQLIWKFDLISIPNPYSSLVLGNFSATMVIWKVLECLAIMIHQIS